MQVLPTADPSEDEDLESWKKRRRISWAQLISKVFEVDPMLCSFCGAKLEVLSFTLEHGTIEPPQLTNCGLLNRGMPLQTPSARST